MVRPAEGLPDSGIETNMRVIFPRLQKLNKDGAQLIGSIARKAKAMKKLSIGREPAWRELRVWGPTASVTEGVAGRTDERRGYWVLGSPCDDCLRHPRRESERTKGSSWGLELRRVDCRSAVCARSGDKDKNATERAHACQRGRTRRAGVIERARDITLRHRSTQARHGGT